MKNRILFLFLVVLLMAITIGSASAAIGVDISAPGEGNIFESVPIKVFGQVHSTGIAKPIYEGSATVIQNGMIIDVQPLDFYKSNFYGMVTLAPGWQSLHVEVVDLRTGDYDWDMVEEICYDDPWTPDNECGT